MSANETMSATESATSAASSSAAGGLNLGASNPAFSLIGICLAVGSGLFIGSSFVVKKKGLLSSQAKYGNQVGEGHGYLKSVLWWTGMIMMIVGEVLNFVAYAFTVAILVTPMGSVSVVVAAILSHFFLKESLTFFGWLGCILCILGSIILALNAPKEQTVRTIKEFEHFFIGPGFLVWMSLMFIISLVIVFWVAPRWGTKTMLPYITVCSLVGGISVSCTQGLGSAIVTSIQGESQIKNWFFWFLLVFVIVTLLIEINYLNKALALFNTSMVVPVYFCFFTSATMVSSFILYRGLKAPAVALVTMVMGFLVICFGITILQMSKVDPKQLQGLDRRSTLLLQASHHRTEGEEKGDVTASEEPGMDALRGGFGSVGSIIRARSVSRKMSQAKKGNARGTSSYSMNTTGLSHLPRYQLSDNPVPEEMEPIALSPANHSPEAPYAPFSPYKQVQAKRSESMLKFDDSDVVHQYGYKQHDGQTAATHTVIAHEGLRDGTAFVERQLTGPQREKSFAEYSNPYEEGDRVKDSKTSLGQLFGAFTHSMNPDSPKSPSGPRSPGGHHFPINLLHSNRDDVRGGAHRGVRDYPHLPKHEEAAEREERAALVAEPEASSEEEMDHLGRFGGGGFTEAGDLSSYSPMSPPTPNKRMESSRRPMGPRSSK